MWEIKAPNHYQDSAKPWLFLAGSIEMGAAEDWQKKIADQLAEERGTILNPRRDDWDSSWEQSIHNYEFRQQVEWELEALEQSDLIVLYLSPGTKSPISLLELGLFGREKPMVVCCPDGFWRKGNVEIVCNRYAIPGVEDLDQLITGIKVRLAQMLEHA